MTRAREDLRTLLAGPACTPVAPIFDPLSARIAEMVGWTACKVAGSVGKAASLAVPDGVPLTNMSDLVDICRRITRVTDVSLIVDADDGGEGVLTIYRTVQELERAGASAIEIEDNAVPSGFGRSVSRHSLLIGKDEQIGKLKAAVAARRDSSTVIVARTSAVSELPLEEALDRVGEYAATGAEAIYLCGRLPNGRSDIEAVHGVADLPLYLLRLPPDVATDPAFLQANRVTLRPLGQSVYGVAVKAIYDSLKHLRDGGSEDELKDRVASQELLSGVTRARDFAAWQDAYESSLAVIQRRSET